MTLSAHLVVYAPLEPTQQEVSWPSTKTDVKDLILYVLLVVWENTV
jgi:hypothetical protein